MDRNRWLALLFIVMMATGIFLAACATEQPSFPPESVAQWQTNYEKINEVPLSKNEIFKNIIEWIENADNSVKFTISQQDKESGKITGNGESNIIDNTAQKIPFVFSFSISIKENKYLIRYENVLLAFGGGRWPIRNPSYIGLIHAKFKDLGEGLEGYLSRK